MDLQDNGVSPETGDDLSVEGQDQVDNVNSNMVPYSRFQQVLSERNEKDAMIARLNNQLIETTTKFASMATPQGTAPTDPTSFETVDQLVDHIKNNVVNKTIEERIKPIQDQYTQQVYSSNLESYFGKNQEAAQLRNEMNQYVDKVSSERKAVIAKAIASGDTSPLDEVFWTIKGQRQQELQGQATTQAGNESRTAQVPSSFKTIRAPENSLLEAKKQSLESGNFRGFFSEIAKNQFG